MLKTKVRRLHNERGFTLVELLAVLVIIAVIAAIAIPLIGGIIKNSKADAEVATARQIYEAARLYIIGEKLGVVPTTGVTVAEMKNKGYLDKTLKNPKTNTSIPDTAKVNFDADGVFASVDLDDKTNIVASEILEGKQDRN